MTDDSSTPEVPPAAVAPTKPVNRLALVSGASAAGLAIGSLTPWVTFLGFGISGVSIHYGLVSLVAAAVLATFSYLTTRTTTTRVIRRTAAAAALGALLSLAAAVYVGWAIRSSYADDSGGDEISQAFADAFRPGLGVGIWLVLLAGAGALACTLPTAFQRSLSSRPVVLTLAALTALVVGGTVAADQEAQADRRDDLAAAQARAAAEEEAEAEAERAEEAAEAAAEQARLAAEAQEEAAEAADRQRFTVSGTTCRIDEYGGATASGTLRNTSSAPRTYTVRVVMTSKAGQQVGDGTDYLSDVAPGTTAAWEAFGYDDAIAACSRPSVEVSEY